MAPSFNMVRPVAPFLPSQAIWYVVPAVTLVTTRLVVRLVPAALSFESTSVRLPSDVPV